MTTHDNRLALFSNPRLCYRPGLHGRMTVPGKTVAGAVELAREEVAQIRRKAEELYDNSFTDNLVTSGFLKEL